jgi:hypothetical protein
MVGLLVAGCSSEGPTTFEIAPSEYDVAFKQTREVLRDWHFNVDRVDAASGVITTRPKFSAGLATPWVSQQSSLTEEWEDFANRQERRVRVTFEPKSLADSAESPQGTGGLVGSPFVDVRQSGEPVIARVEVTVDRVQLPGWQPQTKSIRRSGRTRDPALEDRGMWPEYRVPDRQDPDLAARLVREITERVQEQRKQGVPDVAGGQDAKRGE